MDLPLFKDSVYILDFDGVFVSNIFKVVDFDTITEDELKEFYFRNLNSADINEKMISYVKLLKKNNNKVYLLTGRKEYMVDYVRRYLNSNGLDVDEIISSPSERAFDKYVDWKLSEIERIVKNNIDKRIVFIDDTKGLVEIVAKRFDIIVYRYLFQSNDNYLIEKIKS